MNTAIYAVKAEKREQKKLRLKNRRSSLSAQKKALEQTGYLARTKNKIKK